MSRFLWICLGGAVGTGARYLLSGWALKRFGTSFPYGTLVVNVFGCFLIGALMHLALSSPLISPTLRLVLVVGVMGGFTTYSSFNYETIHYLREGALLLGLLNVLIMVAACLAFGFAGLASGRWLLGR
jgi:CrcB protein